jgi:ankyrin repeat protein
MSNPNWIDGILGSANWTPLELMHHIVTEDDIHVWDIILPMISKKEINQDVDGMTLFMNCCQSSTPLLKKKIIRLIHYGADINVCIEGKTALSYLVKTNEVEVVKWLISNGADPTKGNLLAEMFRTNDSYLREWIEDMQERSDELGADFFIPEEENQHAYENLDMLKFILSLSLPEDEFGRVPLTMACQEGNLEKIILLLEHGYEPPEFMDYLSELVYQQVLITYEERKQEERKQWFMLLMHDKKIPTDSMFSGIETIHNQTLTQMILPFL